CHRLTPWPSVSHLSLSRTAFPGALLRPLSGRASCLARACGTSPSSDFSPSTGHPFAFWAYRCASAPRSLHAEHPMRSPGVTTCSSAPCRPHTPWFEGWMENAFVAIVPTRPCPLFGRPVHRRDGSHRFRPGASPQALRIPPRGGHPALPDLRRGQRGVPPAFGYGALHPSTSGTSPHLSTSLPSAHYEPSRRRLVFGRFPGSPVIRPTWLRRSRGGTRTVSPVARHALVTVLPLPTPPEGHAAPVSPRSVQLPSPRTRGPRLPGHIFLLPPLG